MKEKFETIIAFPRLAGKRVEPPVNVLPMAAVLDRQGISSVRVIDGESLKLSPEQLVEEVLKNQPKIVGISIYTPTYPNAKEILRLAKRLRPEILTVVGGKHPTHFYREVLDEGNVDIVVVGEGEAILPQIVGSFSDGKEAVRQTLEGKPGIAFKGDVNVTLAPKVDLKTLPPLDFKFLYPNLEFYLNQKELIVDMESSRGCFGRCTFCLAARYRKGVSFKEPRQLVEEIQYLTERGVKNFFLTDDDFMANPSHMQQVLRELLRKELKPNIEVNARPDSFLNCVNRDPYLAINCLKAGIKTFHIGVESANPDMLDYCRKNIKLGQVEQVVKTGVGSGLTIIINYIVGLPYDTERSIKDSIRFAERLKSFGRHLSHISIFMPYPGTEAYEDAAREGLLDPHALNLTDLQDVHKKVVVPTKFLSISEIEALYNAFHTTFYSPEYMETLRRSNFFDYKTALYLESKKLD